MQMCCYFECLIKKADQTAETAPACPVMRQPTTDLGASDHTIDSKSLSSAFLLQSSLVNEPNMKNIN